MFPLVLLICDVMYTRVLSWCECDILELLVQAVWAIIMVLARVRLILLDLSDSWSFREQLGFIGLNYVRMEFLIESRRSMVLTRYYESRDVEPSPRGRASSRGRTQGRGRPHGAAPTRRSARGLSPEPYVEQVGEPAEFTMPPLIASAVMSSDDQKRFKRFIQLGPPKFGGVVAEDAYEFLIESYGVSYTSYQLKDVARYWWRSFVSFSGHGATQAAGVLGKCYAIPSKPEAEASDTVITGDSLVVDWAPRCCVMTFSGHETLVDLLVLDINDFDVILGMDWLAPYHTIIDFYAKIMSLASPALPKEGMGFTIFYDASSGGLGVVLMQEGQVKAERMRLGGLLQRLPVIMDRLTKSAHFIWVQVLFSVERLACIYIHDIEHLHGVPVSIILDQSPVFTSHFWKTFQDELGTQVDLSTTFTPDLWPVRADYSGDENRVMDYFAWFGCIELWKVDMVIELGKVDMISNSKKWEFHLGLVLKVDSQGHKPIMGRSQLICTGGSLMVTVQYSNDYKDDKNEALHTQYIFRTDVPHGGPAFHAAGTGTSAHTPHK
ncbi:hypothetical protein FXO37_28466 [Capsicum annuum]|nr:hypothetical protein FXO37_28466 [Capsicum annuum]